MWKDWRVVDLPDREHPLGPKKIDRVCHHWFQFCLSVLSFLMALLIAYDWLTPGVTITSFVVPTWPTVAVSLGTLTFGSVVSIYSLIFVNQKSLKRSWKLERLAALFAVAGWLGLASFSFALPNLSGALVYTSIAFMFAGRFFVLYRLETESDKLVTDHRERLEGK